MALGTDDEQGADGRANIFVSYSRKDAAFVDRLESALKARGFSPRIDRSEIYAFEDWRQRIEELIVKADTIVFVLSPDAVASEVCQWEVGFAAELKKRFAPIVCRPVDVQNVPPELARLNFIFFDDETKFDARADGLAEALATDIDWIRKHTEFGELARRWSQAEGPKQKGLLLPASRLEEAERWIMSRPTDATVPTEETQGFIAESRKRETRRRNILTASLGVGFAVTAVLAGYAYWQRDAALENGRAAEQQARIAKERLVEVRAERDRVLTTESNYLAQKSREELLAGRSKRAISLALSGLPKNDERPWVPETYGALLEALGSPRQAHTLRGHSEALTAVAFSPDGKQVVTASKDKTARVWDVMTGREIAVLRGHDGELTAAAFSPDGKRVLTAASDKTAIIWDIAGGHEKLILRGHEAPIVSAVFSADGARVLTASEDATARVWNVSTGQEILALRGHEGALTSGVFSPDSKKILTASRDKTARLWDTLTGREIKVLHGHEDTVNSANFSPDGARIVTASDDKTARLWDAAKAKVTFTYGPLDTNVKSATFSRDGNSVLTTAETYLPSKAEGGGRFITIPGNTAIWDKLTGKREFSFKDDRGALSPDGLRLLTDSGIWDLSTGRLIAEINNSESEVVDLVAFSPAGGRAISAVNDKTARIWEVESERQGTNLGDRNCFEEDLCKFSPDGKLIGFLASDDRSVEIRDTLSGHLQANLKAHRVMFPGEHSVKKFNFSNDGSRIVTAGLDGCAYLFEAFSGKNIAGFCSESAVWDASLSADGTRVVTVEQEEIILWDTQSGKKIATLDLDKDWELASPKGNIVITYISAYFCPRSNCLLTTWNDKETKLDLATTLWDTQTGAKLFALNGYAASFSWDGSKIIVDSNDGAARIFDTQTGQEIMMLPGNAFSTDGKLAITTSEDKTETFWNLWVGREPIRLQGHTYTPSEVSVSPNGPRAITNRGEDTRLWNLTDGKEIASVKARDASFSADGRWLVIDTADAVDLLDAATGRVIARFVGRGAKLSPDGRRLLLSGSGYESRIIWIHASVEEVLADARARVEH